MLNPFRRTLVVRRNEVEIAPEEVFMDSVNIPQFRQEMHEGRIERPIPRRSFILFACALLLGFLAVGWRLVDLGVARGAELSRLALSNKTYPILIQAPRGIVYDRNFEKLVENTPTFAVSISPSAFADDGSFETTLKRIAAVAGKSIREIADANGIGVDSSPGSLLGRSVWPDDTFVASGELTLLVLEVQSHPDEFPNVTIAEAGRRNYLLGIDAAHMVGYVSRPSADDVKTRPNLRMSELIGKSGLELTYDTALRGSPGQKIIEVNAKGEAQRERFIEKPSPGRDIVLEVDAGLQRFAAETLARHIAALGKKAGALVAIDPRDGAIRALVSFPAYDPNMFSGGLSKKEFDDVFGNTAKPLFNRVISGGYPSASTIKPLLATAALEEHTIDPEKTIYDPGYISVPNPFDPKNPTIFKDWKALGVVDMRRAIALSANVYFYSIGGGYGDIPGLGIRRMKSWLERFGWGSPLGIDLGSENAGFIPDPEGKKLTRPNDPIWRIGDTYITSIGQGDVEITPLQLVGAIAAIANNGTLWKPRLAASVVDEDRTIVKEFKPEAIRTDIAKPESFQVVREGMRLAVTEGSASALRDLPFAVAGKTGTAQTGAYGKNHGWFTGFAPYSNPELVISVLVEDGTGGSTDAVPIAKEVLYYYFTHKDNPQPAPLTGDAGTTTVNHQ